MGSVSRKDKPEDVGGRFCALFWKVSNIDQQLWNSREHPGPITVPYRHLPVTESVVLPAFTSECITCPNPIVVPTHRCFPSSGRAALSVRVV
jgi:hypothetical protein